MESLASFISLKLKFFLTNQCGLGQFYHPNIHNFPGSPEISCNAGSIAVDFNTENEFQGHVYVKGRFEDPGCRVSAGAGERLDSIGIELDFADCGVARSRSVNPRGIFVTTTVIIMFHPRVITKVDRALRIQCFYMEAEKTVESELEVSMITTGFQTQQVPMPVCSYSILNGTQDGLPLSAALIGQSAYHKWTCDSETIDTFCMVVHSCFVEDTPGGERIDMIDENGCSIDRFVMGNIEYVSDLVAGVQTHVFKYPDRPNLYFNCQIKITVKDPDQACPLPLCLPLRSNRVQRAAYYVTSVYTKNKAWSKNINYESGCFVNGEDLCADVTTRIRVIDLTTDPATSREIVSPSEFQNNFGVSQGFSETENEISKGWLGVQLTDLFVREGFESDALCARIDNVKWTFASATVACILLTYLMFKAVQIHSQNKRRRRMIVVLGN